MNKLKKDFLFGLRYWREQTHPIVAIGMFFMLNGLSGIPFFGNFWIAFTTNEWNDLFFLSAFMFGLLLFMTLFVYFFFIPTVCYKKEVEKCIPIYIGVFGAMKERNDTLHDINDNLKTLIKQKEQQ